MYSQFQVLFFARQKRRGPSNVGMEQSEAATAAAAADRVIMGPMEWADAGIQPWLSIQLPYFTYTEPTPPLYLLVHSLLLYDCVRL